MLFRKPHPVKGRAAFVPGVWLGKDTESDQHFVADASGVLGPAVSSATRPHFEPPRVTLDQQHKANQVCK